MRRSQRIQSRSYIVLAVATLALAYECAHSVRGRHGLVSGSRLQARSELLAGEIQRLGSIHADLTRDVRLLSDPHPDPDLVGEMAMDGLGFAPAGAGVAIIRRIRR